MDEIEKLKLNDEFNAWYNAEKVEEKCRNSAYSEGYSEGVDNGIIVGKTETKLEIAKLMLSNNESLDKISTYTGLSISELEEISNNKS